MDAAPPAVTEVHAQPDHFSVLLVDDDPLYRESIVANLEEQGLKVAQFSDGGEAVKWLVEGHHCDVVLLDWNMPKVSGAEVLRKLRLLAFQIPVVILTAFASERNEAVALDCGAVDFLDKSRSSSIIARRLRVVAEGAKGAGPKTSREEVLERGPLVLNLKVGRAQWNGHPVPLTVVEFNIVRLLASRAGEDVTYREIYDVVRGKEFFAGDGVNGYRTNVRSLIKRIRQKFRQLDEGFCAIENYPAFGYRWIASGVSQAPHLAQDDDHDDLPAADTQAGRATPHAAAAAPSAHASASAAGPSSGSLWSLEQRATPDLASRGEKTQADEVPAMRNGAADRVVARSVEKGAIHPVVLSGGAGTRLWPLSRQQYPKQLLTLVSERTMLQETVARTADEEGFGAPLVVCNDDHRFLINEQLQQMAVAPQRVVLEPVARNTAPAATAAALLLMAEDPDALMLVQPSDHHIDDVDAFRRAVRSAAAIAASGSLVTFGIRPTRGETGYGYIEKGEPIDGAAFHVRRFTEKPDAATAESYASGGTHYWNSGIFLMRASAFLEEMRRLQPETVEACEKAVAAGQNDLSFFRLNEGRFGRAADISIDRAVMEHTERAAVVPVEIGWSDIGSWHSLKAVKQADGDGNVIEGDVVADDVHDCYIHADNHLVAAIGLDNVVVVATDDVILVADARRSATVGRLVARLGNRPERLQHTKIYRPWGFYQTVDAGDRFQVKRIMVRPGGKLSLQMHHHRAEHWVVVSGTAKVTCNGETRLLHENEATYIPVGSTHRLENPGKVPLHLIEVQSGAYLGEDDIVRLEDTYGRH